MTGDYMSAVKGLSLSSQALDSAKTTIQYESNIKTAVVSILNAMTSSFYAVIAYLGLDDSNVKSEDGFNTFLNENRGNLKSLISDYYIDYYFKLLNHVKETENGNWKSFTVDNVISFYEIVAPFIQGLQFKILKPSEGEIS